MKRKKPYAVKAKELHDEIAGYLGIKTISQVRVLIRYDIEIFQRKLIHRH